MTRPITPPANPYYAWINQGQPPNGQGPGGPRRPASPAGLSRRQASHASPTKMQHYAHNNNANGIFGGHPQSAQYGMPYGLPHHGPPGYGGHPGQHIHSPGPSLHQQHHHNGMHNPHTPGSYISNGSSGLNGMGPPSSVGGSSTGGRANETTSGYWQEQITRAQASLDAAGQHHHARVDYLQKRGTPAEKRAGNVNSVSLDMANDSAAGDAKSLASNGAIAPHRGAAPAEGDDESGRRRPDEAEEEEQDDEQHWTEIDLGGMAITNLAIEMFAYSFLTALFLPHNSISYLPPGISSLVHLRRLDVSSNKLTSLPGELGVLFALRELLLFDNRLTTLPAELGGLFQLQFLGIEGNPNLHHELRELVERGGTTGLIQYLRDNAPMSPAPPEREWFSLDAELPPRESEEEMPPESFSVLSYNILCDKYATESMYGYTPSWALSWDYRKEQIMRDLMRYPCDLFCLQEVDGEQYEAYFLPHMNELGFEGVYSQKSRARTMSTEERKLVDGCATFYRSSMFSLVETQVVEFNLLAMRRSDYKKTEDMFNRVMTKDQIASIALLEHRMSGARLIVVNVHLYWDHEYRDVKLAQMALLMDELDSVGRRFAQLSPRLNLGPGYTSAPKYSEANKIPTLICGDLNSTPNSGIYDFLHYGHLPREHPDFLGRHYGAYGANGLSHPLTLRSAYHGLGELPFTNYTPGFKGAIDWIWYSSNALAVTGVLGPVEHEWMKGLAGIPNAHYPSDHLPILAELKFRDTKA